MRNETTVAGLAEIVATVPGVPHTGHNALTALLVMFLRSEQERQPTEKLRSELAGYLAREEDLDPTGNRRWEDPRFAKRGSLAQALLHELNSAAALSWPIGRDGNGMTVSFNLDTGLGADLDGRSITTKTLLMTLAVQLVRDAFTTETKAVGTVQDVLRRLGLGYKNESTARAAHSREKKRVRLYLREWSDKRFAVERSSEISRCLWNDVWSNINDNEVVIHPSPDSPERI